MVILMGGKGRRYMFKDEICQASRVRWYDAVSFTTAKSKEVIGGSAQGFCIGCAVGNCCAFLNALPCTALFLNFFITLGAYMICL